MLATFLATVLMTQGTGATLPLILGFQATGSASAWGWGIDTFAQDIETRRFHLLRFQDGHVIEATLPRDLVAAEQDLYPGASFLDDERGFIVWTQDPVVDNGEVRFTLATAVTLNGGRSWEVLRQSVNAGFTFTGVKGVQFTDSQNGHVIVGVGGAMGSTFKTLLHTHDGGKHWDIDASSSSVVGSENSPIHMVFRSNTEGWILTAGVHGQPPSDIRLRHTTDGGKSWHLVNGFAGPALCRPDCSVEDVSPVFFDAENFQGTRAKRTRRQARPAKSSGFPSSPRGAHPRPLRSQEGFLVAVLMYSANGSGPLKRLPVRYRTHDGGASWSAPEKFNPPGPQWNFADFEVGLAETGSKIFLTRDGGRTWAHNSALSRILAAYRPSVFQRQLYRNETSLWLVAEEGERSLVVHSEDEGKSWRVLRKGDFERLDGRPRAFLEVKITMKSSDRQRSGSPQRGGIAYGATWLAPRPSPNSNEENRAEGSQQAMGR